MWTVPVLLRSSSLSSRSVKTSLMARRPSRCATTSGGIVAKVVSDKVMSQVELVTGNLSIVSLVSTEAVRELGLQVGSIAVAQVKATNVSLQLPVTR